MNKYQCCPSQKANKAAPRKPLRNLNELAEEFGVLMGQLMYALKNAPTPPPAERLISGGRGKRWFDPDEMRAWWKSIGGADFAVSEHAERNKRYSIARRSQSSMTARAQ